MSIPSKPTRTSNQNEILLRLNDLLASSLGVKGGQILAAGATSASEGRAMMALGGDMTVTFTASADWGGASHSGVVIPDGTVLVVGTAAITSIAGDGKIYHYL